ncbi:AI-2E family transporter [Paenibacillus macquariensis]|uniref:Predicted PurR-regulated permease PerM n=1 Tax=Paenibacillus macquariensis TaxID=948756 RepID=A0ABY1JLD5_9BACL|nr:AI-2E family transporter [Paenibacillus macquariensis]MEC0090129.1 AI-2E family transporter [Paenibacillus macquariensis]OAB31002.1 AI-2E family transporter [Paenibacillus macquariensis subsp. macquariensis]SIQ38219.1 Predicted PurR-regulated permease PerM [Paenibacillus macquariensis]
MNHSKYFRTCLSIIATMLIIYLAFKLSFILLPVLYVLNLLLIPFVLSGFLFYLLRPIINFLQKKNIHRGVSVILIYFVFAGLLFVFSILVWPTLRDQVLTFVDNAPHLVTDLQKQLQHYQMSSFMSKVIPSESELYSRLTDYLNRLVSLVTNSISNFVGVISNVVIILATIPIILYYMLKEGSKIPHKFLHFIPRQYRRESKEMLHEIDTALSQFIVGRVLINLILGVMMYIGFLIIDLPYALLLSLISAALNLIPYVGALIATIPVVIVALTVSPSMAIWSVIIIVIAQQIQDNILSPIIYGKQLDIHPLTTVILLLIGAEFFGIMGVILAIPAYMIMKIIFVHIYRLFFSDKIEDIVD